jgi:hypothetical protein
LNLAACCIQLKQPVDAVAACNRALEHDPRSMKGLYRRAQARQLIAAATTCPTERASTLGAANADTEEALRIEPGNVLLRRLLRSLAADQGAAIKELRPQPVAERVVRAPTPQEKSKLPRIAAFFADDAVPVEMRWHVQKGRFIVAKRALAAGEIVLACDHYALVPSLDCISAAGGKALQNSDDSQLGRSVQQRLQSLQQTFSTDDDETELLHEVLQTEEARAAGPSGVRRGGDGIAASELIGDRELLRIGAAMLTHSATDPPPQERGAAAVERAVQYRLSFDDVLDLMSHEDELRKQLSRRALDALDYTARLLRKALGPALAAAPPDSVLGSLSHEHTVSLLLRIKYNAHPVTDESSQSRKIGLGLYPAAAYINHGCTPNVVFSHTNEGRVIIFRALRPIEPGEEILYQLRAISLAIGLSNIL